MRNRARLPLRLTAVAVIATVGAMAAVRAAAPAYAQVAAPPGLGSDGSEGTERSAVVGTPRLTAKDVEALAEKDAVARADHAAVLKARAASEAGRPVSRLRLPATAGTGAKALNQACPDGDCSWRTVLSITQVAQSNSYYCGPAMLVSLVKARSISISQGTAASRLRTTTNGTDWYNGSTYPVQSALNHYLGPHGAYYAPVSLPGSPTSTQKSQYQSRLMSNVNRNWGIAGDAWEVPGGPKLVGHPNQTIFHWFAIRGYFDWGARTNYADSASGASSISWSGSVPRYSTMNSNTIVTIMGGRGYIW